jgi:drug/metabolite transporter (DMT)-like permease
MAVVQVTYFYAISQIQVVAAILLQYMSPVLVAIYSMVFWGEKSNISRIAALGLSILGCYLVVGGYNLELLRMNRLGIFAGIAAAFSYAVYALLGEKAMHTYRPWTVVFYSLAFAAVTWQFIHPPFKFMAASYSLGQWLGILYIVVFGTILPFGFYFTGINFLRSTRAMITATLEPISAGIMAFVFLGEELELLQLVGAALVLGAIVLLQINREHDEMAPNTIRQGGNLRA